jgi:hypothetical protein
MTFVVTGVYIAGIFGVAVLFIVKHRKEAAKKSDCPDYAYSQRKVRDHDRVAMSGVR